MGPDAYPQDPVGNMGPVFNGKTGTIADYAEANGQKMIQTNVGVSDVNGAGLEYLLQQDGTFTYMINGSLIDDSDGNRLPDGAAVGGGTNTKDGVHYVQESSIGAMETLPREITVRGYNIWDKNRYETNTFEMR